MKSIVFIVALLVIAVVELSQSRNVLDPCFSPGSQDCIDLMKEIEEREKKFDQEFWSEIRTLLAEWAEKNKDLQGEDQTKALINDSELKKKVVDIIKSKGLGAVAKAYRAQQKAVQNSLNPYPENILVKFWETENLLDALENLAEIAKDLPKEKRWDIHSDLINGQGHAEWFLKDLKDSDKELHKKNIERIDNIAKKVDVNDSSELN